MTCGESGMEEEASKIMSIDAGGGGGGVTLRTEHLAQPCHTLTPGTLREHFHCGVSYLGVRDRSSISSRRFSSAWWRGAIRTCPGALIGCAPCTFLRGRTLLIYMTDSSASEVPRLFVLYFAQFKGWETREEWEAESWGRWICETLGDNEPVDGC